MLHTSTVEPMSEEMIEALDFFRDCLSKEGFTTYHLNDEALFMEILDTDTQMTKQIIENAKEIKDLKRFKFYLDIWMKGR